MNVTQLTQEEYQYFLRKTHDVSPVPQTEERPDLGPRQIAWCEANLPNFRHCKAQADAAEQHRREIERQLREQA